MCDMTFPSINTKLWSGMHNKMQQLHAPRLVYTNLVSYLVQQLHER